MDKVIFFFFFELTNVSLLYFSRVGNMFLKGYPLEAKTAPKN